MNTPETLGSPNAPVAPRGPARSEEAPKESHKAHHYLERSRGVPQRRNVARDITIATVIAQKICHEQGWSALEEIAEAINKPDTAKTPEIARAAQLQRELRELFKEGVRLNLDSHQ